MDRRIHQVVIVPAHGWASDDGNYSRGSDIGWTAEVDLVDLYVSYLVDTLDQEGIRHQVLGTRKKPGIPLKERPSHIPVNSLVLHCGLGWHRNHAKVELAQNHSKTFYHYLSAATLARYLAEAIGQWGELTVHSHKAGKASTDAADKLLYPEGSQGIRLEPFLINGPEVREYSRHLARLGQDIGWTVAEYCREVQQGCLPRTAVIR